MGARTMSSFVGVHETSTETLTVLGLEPGAKITVSHDELRERAAVRAAGLASIGVSWGEPVGLFARTTLDFVIGCFAIWRRGAVVVSLPPSARLGSRSAWEARTASTLAKAGVKRLLVDRSDAGSDLGVEPVAMDSLDAFGLFDGPRPSASDIALIQFSSGSTSDPKGVVLDHAAVVAHVDAHWRSTEADGANRLPFSWLPLSHDLGFINYLVTPVAQGARSALMPTEAFIERPLRWIEEMSRLKATAAAGPNSAYALAARQLEKETSLRVDLSEWRHAAAGGEAVDGDVLERFLAAAQAFGFERSSLVPGYGLAEATCVVSRKPPGSDWRLDRVGREDLARGVASPASTGSSGVASFVSMGLPIDGVAVEILDPSGAVLADRRVGEIAVRGPTVMRGYVNDPEATAQSLDDGRLRTGDLGYLADGELFITGRLKDLIIVAGQNYFAEDIEKVVEAVPGVRKGGSAAIPVSRGDSEGLGIVAETARVADPSELRSTIARSVLAETGVGPAAVFLVESRTLPKTTSGKKKRGEVKAMFERGRFVDDQMAASQEVGGPSALEAQLIEIISEALGRQVGVNDDIFDLGATSLEAASILSEIDRRLNKVLPYSILMEASSASGLATAIGSGRGDERSSCLVQLADGARPPLFAVPGALGLALGLRPLAARLEDTLSLYAFEGSVAGAHRWPRRTVREVAADYVAELVRLHPGPYPLLGFSFGGVVAHEMAVQLTSAGHEVPLLAVLDSPTPVPEMRGTVDHIRKDRRWRSILRGIGRWGVLSSWAWMHLSLGLRMPARAVREFLLLDGVYLTLRHKPRPFPGRLECFRVVKAPVSDSIAERDGAGEWAGLAESIRVHHVVAPSHVDIIHEPWVSEVADRVRLLAMVGPGGADRA